MGILPAEGGLGEGGSGLGKESSPFASVLGMVGLMHV